MMNVRIERIAFFFAYLERFDEVFAFVCTIKKEWCVNTKVSKTNDVILVIVDVVAVIERMQLIFLSAT